MQKNIKLIKYKKFGDELLLFEQINAPKVKPIIDKNEYEGTGKKSADKTFAEQLENASKERKELYFSIRDYILSLGDDVTENQLKLYTAFKKIKNIICVELRVNSILLFLKLNPDDFIDEQKREIVRDVRKIGHWGTGDLEIVIRTASDFDRVKYIIDRCYKEN